MVVELDFRSYSVNMALRGLLKRGRPGQFYSVRNVYEYIIKDGNADNFQDINEVDKVLNIIGKRKGSLVIQRTNPSGFTGYRFDEAGHYNRIEREAKNIAYLLKRLYESQTLTPEILNLPITI